jgi:predicted nucleic acid-binding protein
MTNVDGLLDTNIFVDILRGYASAINWMQSNPGLVFAIPSFVRMELVLGSQNKIEQEKALKLLNPYPVIFPTEIDAQWAMQQFEIHHLKSQVEIIDCFIAAMAVRLKLPIYTRNVKDLRVFEGLVIRVPY